MGLFSFTSGRAGRLAAMAQAQQAQEDRAAADARIAQGQAGALGAINAGEPLSLAALGTGYDQARGQYGAASARFQPYADTGLKAFNQYADATGVNGQGGYDSAVGNFRAGPGYQYAVDQATDAVARKASSLGSLGSGNTMAAISDRAGHMADQEYDQYLSRLNGIGQMGYQATGAQAGLDKGIGDLYAEQGRGTASIYDSNAKARAGVHTGMTGLGVNSILSTGQRLGDAKAGGFMAGQQASANNFGAIMGGLNLGANLLGSAFGGGGGSFGKMFLNPFGIGSIGSS